MEVETFQCAAPKTTFCDSVGEDYQSMTATWPIKQLDELCEVTSSKRIYATELCSSGVPFYRSKEIIAKLNGEDFPSSTLYISEERFQEILRLSGAPVEGDILLTSRGTLGVPYIVKDSDRFHFADGNLTWFRNFRHLDSHYLKYFFISPTGKAELSKCVIGSSQAAYTIASLKKFEILLPPLPLQRRIAGILSAYDDLIENCQRRIKILETMARDLYREWFVNFRFPGHEIVSFVPTALGDIPEGWEVKPFTEIADVLSGGTPKTDVAEYWNGEIPFFTPRDAPSCFYIQDSDKHLTELGLTKCASQLYPPDTVFITARGTVGKVALPSVPMAMNQSCYALRGKKGILQRFLFLMTLQQVDYLKTNTGGATFDTIVVDTFRGMKVVKPSINIIVDFAQQTDPIFDQMNVLQRKIQNLRRTREMLLPHLLRGGVNLKEQ
jgi:type I restriction enzyme S subunit